MMYGKFSVIPGELGAVPSGKEKVLDRLYQVSGHMWVLFVFVK